MKQYEKLGFDTESALKWVDGCKTRLCGDCSAREHRPGAPAFCAVSYLLSDVPETPKVPRWKTAKTQEDFERFYTDYMDCCGRQTGCTSCKYGNRMRTAGCYHAYLTELIDAPESEDDNGKHVE